MPQAHAFGGTWTDQKIELIRRYLDAYTTALKRTRFRLMYVDAFAGTGFRSVASSGAGQADRLPGFPEIDELVKGSARVALEIGDRPFDEYVFVEKNRTRFAALRRLRDEFPDRAESMRFMNEDANNAIVRLCRETNWRRTRAVMFLDPYGMQVEWRVIEAIARTRSVDLWYLFPVGMGVVRMTPRSGIVDPTWQKRLDIVLGEQKWREVFYRASEQSDLFEDGHTEFEKQTDVETVEKYVLDRLSSVFAGVAPKAWRLNKARQCMYLLAFAVANEAGKSIALRIAGYLINERST